MRGLYQSVDRINQFRHHVCKVLCLAQDERDEFAATARAAYELADQPEVAGRAGLQVKAALESAATALQTADAHLSKAAAILREAGDAVDENEQRRAKVRRTMKV